MHIQLDMMEIVWLQSIRRNPHKYWNGHNIYVNSLLNVGLVFEDSRDMHDRLVITELGKEVLNKHLPFLVYVGWYGSSDVNQLEIWS